jgi:hypothetical protein
MKKFIGICALLLMVGCKEIPPAKDYSCKEWSVECELQKDRILIQPITLDSFPISDAYAYPVLIDSTYWYIVNTQLGILAPVKIRVILECHSTSNGYSCSETHHPTVTELTKKGWGGNKDKIDFKVEEVSLLGIVPGVNKAYLIIMGPNEVFVSSQEAFIAKPKLAKK